MHKLSAIFIDIITRFRHDSESFDGERGESEDSDSSNNAIIVDEDQDGKRNEINSGMFNF